MTTSMLVSLNVYFFCVTPVCVSLCNHSNTSVSLLRLFLQFLQLMKILFRYNQLSILTKLQIRITRIFPAYVPGKVDFITPFESAREAAYNDMISTTCHHSNFPLYTHSNIHTLAIVPLLLHSPNGSMKERRNTNSKAVHTKETQTDAASKTHRLICSPVTPVTLLVSPLDQSTTVLNHYRILQLPGLTEIKLHTLLLPEIGHVIGFSGLTPDVNISTSDGWIGVKIEAEILPGCRNSVHNVSRLFATFSEIPI